jgi:hypothetical protein
MSRQLGAAVLFATMMCAGVSLAQRPPRASALDWPAIDGASAARLHVGQDERAVVALFGDPDESAPSFLAERRLRYEIVPGVGLEVHVQAGRIEGIGFTLLDGQPPPRSPRTVRGIQLGAPVASVVERYGEPAGGRYWYAAEGIAFNLEGAAETVTSILIFPPGTPAR